MIPIIGWMIGAYILVRAVDMRYQERKEFQAGMTTMCKYLIFFDVLMMFALLIKEVAQ